MTSKLDYLKKYDANAADNGKEGKKKKKKQHTATQPRVLGMMMVDAEVDVLPTVAAVAPGTTTMQSSLWDVGGEDDDDGPVVIETAEVRKVAKGAWAAVDDVPSIPIPSSSTSSSIQLPRRTRHDSSDDEEDVPRRRPVVASTDNTSHARTTRHDSSDEDVPRRRPAVAAVPEKTSQSRRTRHDSDDDDDASPPRRSTVPSSSSALDTVQVTATSTKQMITSTNHATGNRRQRHDSSDDEDVPRRRPRVNDDSDEEPPRKPSVESAEVKVVPEGRRSKTASGHDAGLQSSSQFGKTEKELKAQRDLELANADPSLLGSQAETVYRDRKGKKLDMLNEFMRQQAVKEGKEVKLEKAQMEWGRGSVQKEEAALARKEMEEIANEPFARTIDNPRLEAIRKEAIRDGDPMAEYFMQKKEKEEAVVGPSSRAQGSSSSLHAKQKPQKPKYKGPLGLPNRFSILPGYRWDGIDRGNRYEHKILTKQNDRNALKEDEYRWSTQDM